MNKNTRALLALYSWEVIRPWRPRLRLLYGLFLVSVYREETIAHLDMNRCAHGQEKVRSPPNRIRRCNFVGYKCGLTQLNFLHPIYPQNQQIVIWRIDNKSYTSLTKMCVARLLWRKESWKLAQECLHLIFLFPHSSLAFLCWAEEWLH